MRPSISIVAVASLVALGSNTVHAWGAVGHTLTGLIAQQYLTSNTASQISSILPASYNGQLSSATPWADSVRFLSQYSWATPLHFFDPANDNPPVDCKAVYVYGGQDSVNALFNMTTTLKNFKSSPPTTSSGLKKQQDALRFFSHFMGDIHQPLHDSTPFRGGNDAPIKWGTKTSNLHSMWDTLLITTDITVRFNNDQNAYLEDTLKLADGYWKDVSTWTVCDPSKLQNNPWSPVSDSVKTLCPIEWAASANALDCSYVWVDYSATRDYSTTYFANVTGPDSGYLVQQQLAKAGIRMAAVLNEIYDPSPAQKRRLQYDH